MDEETKKIITEQLKTLPQEIKDAILSVDYAKTLEEIYKRQKLLIDQSAKLEMETTLVMIGLEPISDYLGNLEKNLQIPHEKAAEIATDVNENIFKKILESLKKMDEGMLSENEKLSQLPDLAENPEEIIPKFTDSNEPGLNRDQILKEIEDPSLIGGGDRSINIAKPAPEKVPPVATTTEIEIRPAQEIKTIPGQEVKTVIANTFEAKMTAPTVIPQEIIIAKPENKLPEVEKKKPSSGVDPYREPLM